MYAISLPLVWQLRAYSRGLAKSTNLISHDLTILIADSNSGWRETLKFEKHFSEVFPTSSCVGQIFCPKIYENSWCFKRFRSLTVNFFVNEPKICMTDKIVFVKIPCSDY